MKVRDVMTTDVTTVEPGTSLKEVAAILAERHISGLPVVDAAGSVVGVVSESDIVAKKGRDVKTIMSKKLIAVDEETAVEEIAQLMTTHKIKRLPVMNGDKVVGIVSRADIVNAIAMGKHVALNTPVYDL
jgi:CBS domain-containing protein